VEGQDEQLDRRAGRRDHKTVESWREKLFGNSQAETHTGKDGKKYKAQKPKPPAAVKPPPAAEPDEVEVGAKRAEDGTADKPAAAAPSDIMALVKELTWELEHSDPTEAERDALLELAARIEAELAEEEAAGDSLSEGDDGDERDGQAAGSEVAPDALMPELPKVELPKKVVTVTMAAPALQPGVG
jgi:hypothetical protein